MLMAFFTGKLNRSETLENAVGVLTGRGIRSLR